MQAAGREAVNGILCRGHPIQMADALTGGVAHDLNNHLNSIVGALSLMESRIEHGNTGELLHYISAANAAVRRAAVLTQRLLAIARGQQLEPVQVNVNELVASLEDLLRLTLGPNISLETSSGVDSWTTLCDPDELENVVLNLATNARDAMPDGGRLVIQTDNVRLERSLVLCTGGEVGPGDYVMLEFTDTGVGMPSEVIERLFEPFFTTKLPGKGTGLGLPMVHNFVDKSGGHLVVQSEPGDGANIRIYLPRHRPEVATAAAKP